MTNTTLKKKLKHIFLIDKYQSLHNKRRDKRLKAIRQQYFPQLIELVSSKTSVITNNCFAGLIMQDLNMEYNSPTLGLYFMFPDYIEFLQHLEFYLKEAKIVFLEQSRCDLANQRRQQSKAWYPIGLLGGKVEIQFLHYHSEDEASDKWYRRAARVNMDDLVVIGMDQNLCSIHDIEMFDKMPYERKLFFSTHNLPQLKSNVYVQEFSDMGQVGDPYRQGHIFYKYLCQHMKTKQNNNSF